MRLLQLNQLNKERIKEIGDSFNNLPRTSHKDGKYRLRRYSVVELRTTFWSADTQIELAHLPHRSFEQSEKLNEFQGGMARDFEEIEEGTLQSDCMREACLVFKRANDLPDSQEVEIHQMRVITVGEETPVAPEGIHQDGFDCIAMIGIDRHNIEGGELMVYESKESNPTLISGLKRGQMVMLDDHKMWHDASPIERLDKLKDGHGDWLVFCAKVKHE